MLDDVERCSIHNIQNVYHASEQLSLVISFQLIFYKTLRYRLAREVLCLTGSSLDTNSIKFFVLQSPISTDVSHPGFKPRSHLVVIIPDLDKAIH